MHGVFLHDELGQIHLSNADRDIANLCDHKVRESWRRVQFQNSQKQNRRDSHYLSDERHVESQVSNARRMFSLAADGHQRAVMLGAAHLTACYDRMRGNEVRETCPHCSQQIPPVWEHLCWHCPAESFSSGRPEVPDNDIQARLGWPAHGCDAFDRSVLQHLARVRAMVLENLN